MKDSSNPSLIAARLDSAVARAPEIDRFCSASPWVLAALETWPSPGSLLFEEEDGSCLLALAAPTVAGGIVLLPCERAWGYPSPLIGERSPELLERWIARESPAAILLSGIPVASRLLARISEIRGLHWIREPLDRCWHASLDGGTAGFLSRRTAHFRRRLRETTRRVARAGVRFELSDLPPDPLMDRVVHIEARSWKGSAGTGLAQEGSELFYRNLVRRLHARGALRAIFATREGVDVGYLLAGAMHGVLRGLQMSYVLGMESLSLGHALQFAQLESVAGEGLACYDLGMEMPYKRRWAETPFDRVVLHAVIAAPPPAHR